MTSLPTKPPLVEAIFDLFVEDSAGWSPESSARLEVTLGAEFPGRRESVQPVSVALRFGPDGATVQGPGAAEAERRRLWSADGGEVFQFSPSMCAYNVLSGRYTRFEDHVERVRSLLRTYLAEARPGAVRWTGQRYVNRIDIPLAAGRPSDFLEFYPTVPSTVHGPMAMQVLADVFPGGHTFVALSSQEVQDGVARYVLDLYARSTATMGCDADALVEWHETAHESVRRVYGLALKDKVRELVSKEVA